ncbi:winged helix-turn-helix domain-containing protein [Actinomadura kijaniata]|uniref:DNA-binding transcriptional ArsR family regulator n=1 Tax=Actinomadura namibiensis TaxID=182080 RepID=A0A7W3M069_ACTNM|nr:winged helix-turn-helix domain-containing protein [Actinomadura namibiensis]MBA8957588.1 DNA-binding transcriptional ArsR family regulator [Actinomadura namibiensis]
MGWWRVDADTLARGRFVVSPLAETTAALQTLHRAAPAHPGERAWLSTHLPAYRARLAADPVAAALVRVGLGGSWNADFLTPVPTGAAFSDEAGRVRATPPAAARADLEVAAGGPLPPVLDVPDLPERAAALLTWVWRTVVGPDWPRRRRLLEADLVARTGQLTRHGWAAALDDMRPGMRWLGDGRLQVNAYDYPPREISGERLFFVPVTARRGWVAWEADRNAVVYPCSGVLAADRPPAPRALAALLGGPRAEILVLLDTPKSTSQLVALTGQALGSTGRHLRILRDAGLLERRRAGRSVLYYRTPAADALLAAGTPRVS